MAITTAGSNLDVQGLVSQLMSLEQTPLTASKKRETNYSDQVSSLGKMKSTLSDFQTTLRGLISGNSLRVNKTESSDATVLKGSASSTAAAGTYVVNVTALASAQTLALSSGSFTSASNALGNTAAGTLTFSFPGENDGDPDVTKTVNVAAGATLQSLSDAINAAGIDVSASVVNSGTDGYKLALSSKKSGTDGAFSISGGADMGVSFLDFQRDGTDAANLAKRTAAPTDAQMTINGVAITSSSNKVTEAMTGLEVNLYKTGTSTLTVTRDNEAVLKNVQGFVDAYNKVKSQVDTMYKQSSAAGAVTDASGKVIGTPTRLDGSVRMMMQSLASELGTGMSGAALESGYAYLSQIGISLQKDGTLKLNNETFQKAIDKDATAVSNLFGNLSNTGFADRLNTKVNDMLGPQGMLQIRTDSLNQQIRYEKQKQDQVQTRLDLMQKRLLLQFSKLDASLTAMKNQSNSLVAALG